MDLDEKPRFVSHVCVHQYLIPLRYVFPVGWLPLELTLGGLPSYGYSMSGDLWRNTRKKCIEYTKMLVWMEKVTRLTLTGLFKSFSFEKKQT